jgi:hypothetical protein
VTCSTAKQKVDKLDFIQLMYKQWIGIYIDLMCCDKDGGKCWEKCICNAEIWG